MIISHKHQYIFVHIPKTGGTSLTLALENRVGKDDILIGDTPKALRRRKRLKDVNSRGRLWKHSTLTDIYGLVSAQDISRYFIFTLVRNPWDRMVSYYHWLREQGFDHPSVGLAKALEFSAFLNHPMTVQAVSASAYSSYLKDEDGHERCDMFLRLEHLAEDLPALAERLGFRLPEMPHSNPSQRLADWRGYYSDHDADLIGRMCSADIERFGYRF